MTDADFQNMVNAVRTGEKLNAPISDAYIAVAMMLFSNIAWKLNRELTLDPSNGHIVGNSDAIKLCSRQYEKGWEPHI